MPRSPRKTVPGFPHHVMIRGCDRMNIFRQKTDRTFFLHCLRQSKERTGVKIYAYCLMTNHIHLIVVPPAQGRLSQFMHYVGFLYAEFYNERYSRTGPVLEGRFKSFVIDSEAYFIQCVRYVEQNPARAGMVFNPEAYPWSSCWRGLSFSHENNVLDRAPYLIPRGWQKEAAQNWYRGLLKRPLKSWQLESVRKAFRYGNLNRNTVAKVVKRLKMKKGPGPF